MAIAVVGLLASVLTAAPSAAQDPPRRWGEATFTELSTDNGDFEVPFGPGAEQTDAQIADLDGDGINDMIVTNRNLAPAGVWYQRGTTGWTRHVFEANSVPLEAGGTTHDVDGDGDIDIVVGEGATGNAIYWWENPAPAFEPGVPWERHVIKDNGASKHHDVIFGDVDGDGVDEFIFWNDEKRLAVAEIPADPTGGPWPWAEIFFDPDKNEGLAIADVNLDGVDDIIGAGRWFEYVDPSTYTMHMIDPAMEFTRVAVDQLIPGGRPEILFVIGDVSSPIYDGTSFLTMYEWDGAAWDATPLLGELTHAGHSLDIVDVNQDGNLDIFNAEMTLGNDDDAKGRIYYGDGTGDFVVQEFSSGIEHHQSKIGDLDGDGDLDIFGKPFTAGSPALHVWINTDIDPGVFPLDQFTRHSVDAAQPWLAADAVWGDFDLDGNLDIASGGWVYESADGDYSQPWARRLIGAPLNNVALAHDLDGDGDIDLLGTNGQSQTPTHPGGLDFHWARNEGDGTFTILSNITPGVSSDPSAAFVQGIEVFDLGNDGATDIAVSWNHGEFGSSGIDLLTIPADPSNTTWPLQTISGVSEGEQLGLDDIDGDGDLDLFQGSGWLENQHPTWIRHESTTLIGGNAPYDDPDRVSMVDVDGDGDRDAVIGLLFEAISIPTDLVYLEHPADPTGEWPLHVIASGIGGGFSMSAGDVDNDGDDDIVLGEHVGQNRLLIFENVDNATSWVQHVADDGTGTAIDHHDGAQLVDFENDGDLDIVSLGWTNQKVWLFENTTLAPGDLSDIEPPSTPPTFDAVAVASTRVSLDWGLSIDNRSTPQYQVLRDGVLIDTISGLHYDDAGLTPQTSYDYQVVAVDRSGNESAPTPVTTVTTPTTDVVDPSAPGAFAGSASAYRIELSWTPATDDRAIERYELTRNGVLTATPSADSVTYLDLGLDASTNYTYELVAFDAEGNSSAAVDATVVIDTLPAPTDLWLAYGFEDGPGVALDTSIYGNHGAVVGGAVIADQGHTDNALETNGVGGWLDLDRLDIESGDVTFMAWVNPDDFGIADARIFSKATGTSSDNHLWMVSTINDGRLRFRLKTDDGNPTTTLISTGPAMSPGTWHHIAATYDGATMRLFLDGVEVGSTAKTGAVAQDRLVDAYVGANPASDDKVFDGRIDDVRIFGRALTAAEIVFASAIPVGPAVPDEEAPSAPGSVSATAVDSSTVQVGWTPSTDNVGVVRYDVLRDGTVVGSSSVASFTDGGLAAGSTYGYEIRAIDAAGNESARSASASATTPAPDGEDPTVPGVVAAAALSPTVMEITWSASTDNVGVVGYDVLRDGVVVGSTPGLSFLDTGLAGATTYGYSVRARDAAGNSATSTPVDATTDDVPVGGDLVAAFGFADAGGVAADVSGQGNDGVIEGAASIVADGQFGSAAAFTGTNALGSIDLGGVDVAGDGLTLSMWANFDDFGVADARLVSKATGIAANDHWWMLSTFSNGRLRFRLKTDDGNTTTTLLSSTGAISAGTWHFVAATYDGSTMRLFVDGVEVGSAAKTGSVATDGTVDARIGGNPTVASKNIDGRLDEVRIHDRGLSVAELGALATTPVTPIGPDEDAPSVPGSVAANAINATTAQITWTASTDNVGVARYDVLRDGVVVGTPATPSFTDTGLVAGATYGYEVRAVDAAGNASALSTSVSVTMPDPDGENPTTPGSVSAVAQGPTSVAVTWSASTDNVGVVGYDVLRDGVVVGSTAGLSSVDSGLAAATTYGYSVRARDAAGNSATSAAVDVTTDDAPVGGDLVAAFGFADAGAVATDASGQGNDGAIEGAASIVADGQFGSAAAFTGTNALGSIDLGGVDVVGEGLTLSMWANFDDFGIADARLISKTTGTAANDHWWMVSTFSNGRLRFRLKTDDGNATTTLLSSTGAISAGTWHFVAATYDGSTMRLFVDGVEVGSAAKTGSVATDGTVDARIGGNPGTNTKNIDGRLDEVRIHNRGLDAGELAVIAAVPVAPPAPDETAPSVPGSVAASAVNSTTGQITWTASTDNVGVVRYDVLRDGALAGTATTTSFTDTGLAAGGTYGYQVRAVDAAGNESGLSGSVSMTTPAPDVEDPTAPATVSATATGATTVDLSWTAATDNVGVVGYDVLRDGVLVGSTATLAFVDTGLSPSTTYSYAVRARDAAGNSATSGAVAATTDDPPVGGDLVAAYSFDDVGPIVLDRSGSGNDAAVVAPGLLGSIGQFGTAAEIGGNGGGIDLGTLDIAGGDGLTLAGWVRADDFGIYDARIVSKSTGTAANDHWWMLSTFTGRTLRFRLKTDDGNATTTLVGSGGSLTAGTWHFVAATYDGATMRLFLDGVEVGSTAKTGAVAVDDTVAAWLGNNPAATDQAFDGRIDEFRIFNRALDAAELQALAAAPVD